MIDDRKTERKVLRAYVKKMTADDVSARPSMIIHSQLTELSEENSILKV